VRQEATVVQMPAIQDPRFESKGDFKFQVVPTLKKHHFLRRPLPVPVQKRKKPSCKLKT
jgi:hypothetical protein